MSEAGGDSATLQAARDAFLAARRQASAKRKAARVAKVSPIGDAAERVAAQANPSKSSGKASNKHPGSSPTPSKGKGSRAHWRDQRPDYGTEPPEALLGRPRIWTDELRAKWQTAVLLWLSEGKSLSAFARTYPNGPSRWQFFQWLDEDAIFAHQYSRARANGADALADRIIATAETVEGASREDMAAVNAARLMVDSLKWTASKLKPGSYADRLETNTTVNQTVTVELNDDARALALASIMARQAVANAGSLPDALAALQTMKPLPALIDATASTTEQPETARPSGTAQAK